MPLDDLDLPNSINSNPTHKRFYKSGIRLLILGVIISTTFFSLFFFYEVTIYENPFKESFYYLPIFIGLIPFFFSAIYLYFKKSIPIPLKNNWNNIHFYLTIIPLVVAQLFAIPFIHFIHMGVTPFFGFPFPLLWPLFIIGQIYFLANIFRSLKLSFYKNANYHPTHLLFLFVAFCFLLKATASYFLGRNRAYDIQLHDTYFVISHFHIYLFIVFIFLIFAGLYYFLNQKLKKPLQSFLGKSHFFLMLLSVLYFVYAYLEYDFSVRRYYSSPEGAEYIYNFMRNELIIVLGVFLLAQVLFLINFLQSLFWKNN